MIQEKKVVYLTDYMHMSSTVCENTGYLLCGNVTDNINNLNEIGITILKIYFVTKKSQHFYFFGFCVEFSPKGQYF